MRERKKGQEGRGGEKSDFSVMMIPHFFYLFLHGFIFYSPNALFSLRSLDSYLSRCSDLVWV